MFQLINKLLENKSTNRCDITKYKSENISQVIATQVAQKTNGIRNSTVNKNVILNIYDIYIYIY